MNLLSRGLPVEGNKTPLSRKDGKAMTHRLKISVSKEPQEGGILTCRSVTIRERFLRFLFGQKQRLTILVPGDSVDTIAISEVPEEGVAYE